MTPEFSRVEPVDAIGEQERTVAISADAAERAALTRRFSLLAIDRLEARFTIRRDSAGIAVRGTVEADLTQACAVTRESLPVRIVESVELRFVAAAPGAEDVELAEDALDTVEIEDGAIDLGETAAETLALALDPFLRGPGAEAALKAAGVLPEGAIAPFGALAGLRDLLRD